MTLIRKTQRDINSSTGSIIIRKLYKRQKLRLVVLLVVIIYKDITQSLVHIFYFLLPLEY